MTYNDFKKEWVGKYINDFSALTEEETAQASHEMQVNGAILVFVASPKKLLCVNRLYICKSKAQLEAHLNGIVMGGYACGKKIGCRAIWYDKDGGIQTNSCHIAACDKIDASPEWMTITRAYERID